MHAGRYPAWGTSPEWDEVLGARETMADCARYHCRPSELEEEDVHELQVHRAIEAAERQYQAMEARSRANRGRGRRGR